MSGEVDAFTYAAAGMRNMTTEERHKTMSLGIGTQAHTGTLLVDNTGMNATISPQAPLVSKRYMPDTYSSRLEMNLSIVQADNGFVVNVGNEYGSRADVHIAKTIEEVTTIITSQLASRMLDKVK